MTCEHSVGDQSDICRQYPTHPLTSPRREYKSLSRAVSFFLLTIPSTGFCTLQSAHPTAISRVAHISNAKQHQARMPRDLRDYHYKGPRFNRDQGAIGPIHDPWNLYHENTPPFGYTLNSIYNPNNPYRQLPGIRRGRSGIPRYLFPTPRPGYYGPSY
jgi:hypothetical protein